MVRKLALFVCVIAIFRCSVVAENDASQGVSAKVARTNSDVSRSAVDGRWISQLRSNAALLNNDATACVSQCDQLIVSAKLANVEAVVATAMMHRSCAQSILGGVERGIEDFKVALSMFPAGTDATLNLLFMQALCRHECQMGPPQSKSIIKSLEVELEHSSGATDVGVRLDAYGDLLEYKSSLGELGEDEAAEFRRLQIAAGREDLATQLKLLQVRNSLYKRNRTEEDFDWAQIVAIERIVEDQNFEKVPRSLRIELLILAAELNHMSGKVQDAVSYLSQARREADTLQNKTITASCEVLSAEIELASQSWPNCAERLANAESLLSSANSPELLHRFALVVAKLPKDSSSRPFRSSFSNTLASRLQALNACGSLSSATLANRQSIRAEAIFKDQAQLILAKQLQASHEELRSLRIAQIGIAIVGVLVLVLLRERVKLRRVNRRLKEEIRNSVSQRLEREQIELRLAQTERMESLGALAGGVAHDFNNLLVGVMGNADLLRHVEPGSPAAKQCLDGIVRSAESAARLSRKMLAYAGKEPSVKAAIDFNHAADRILPLLQAGLGQKHIIRFEPFSESLMTEVDAGQLDQIILNLTSNASQALANRPGEITIRTGRESLSSIPIEPATFGNRKVGGEFVWLEVQDNGPGIESANISRVFEPFFTTKTDSTGHGFGLSVVYGHVNRHDGLIQLTSVVGEGTSFRILFPVCEVESISVKLQTVPPLNFREVRDDLNLVVVDDQESVLEVVRSIFVGDERKIHAFTSATEAMEFLVDNSQVDCLLIDSMMPVMDGNAMLDELANKQITVPVVMMSGYSTINLSDFQRREQVKAVVQKPFKPDELMAAVFHSLQNFPDNADLTALSPLAE